jgi:hypothetical protein
VTPIDKLVTDQWRGSLGVCDSESCWFTEEIGTYMRCWESPGDLPLVIEMLVSFRSFRCAPLSKRHKIFCSQNKHHFMIHKIFTRSLSAKIETNLIASICIELFYQVKTKE